MSESCAQPNSQANSAQSDAESCAQSDSKPWAVTGLKPCAQSDAQSESDPAQADFKPRANSARETYAHFESKSSGQSDSKPSALSTTKPCS